MLEICICGWFFPFGLNFEIEVFGVDFEVGREFPSINFQVDFQVDGLTEMTAMFVAKRGKAALERHVPVSCHGNRLVIVCQLTASFIPPQLF